MNSLSEYNEEELKTILFSLVFSSDYIAAITVKDKILYFRSNEDLSIRKDFNNFHSAKIISKKYNFYSAPFTAANAYVLRYIFRGRVKVSDEDKVTLSKAVENIKEPFAKLSEDKRHVEVTVPPVQAYKDILLRVDGYPTSSGSYRIGISRVLDFITLNENFEYRLPKIKLSPEVVALNEEPIVGFDGTVNSLKSIPIDSLNVIKANAQTVKARKKSSKTLSEKFADFGIHNLYELLFFLPRRYIDKSKPQSLDNLLVGESITILGEIDHISTLSNNLGIVFIIKDAGSSIRTTFFRQNWLRAKFKVGDKVIVTGKLSYFNQSIQLSGSSIEHSDKAALLPIVPIYKQSESRGITTNLIMSAEREMLKRTGGLEPPVYLKSKSRMSYKDAISQLHFPTSIHEHYQALDSLAFYELIYMQILMLEAKENTIQKAGIPQKAGERKLQSKAVRSLPFELTRSQKIGIVEINKKLSDSKPSTILVNSDVGTGKTLLAQLACLRTVEAGLQAVLLGPTEILARQLYNTFLKLNEGLKLQGEEIRICYLSGGMKAAERKPILKAIENGEVDVVVGTLSVMADSVKYNNLGLVVIDEQQKFGAEQRSRLLRSRDDGLVPDLIMQTATPIPRSTAQVYYGEIDMIELTDKPAGRLPIETQWIREDPIKILSQSVHPIWSDIEDEAKKGNQTFIIAPLVEESDKIDAASVERIYKDLHSQTLSHLRIAYAHGKMKQDEQNQVMQDFRDKKYDVLVASTVVEVGVDIPDATRVVIMSADRLGASSLHQIRGRVGRNSKPSKCYLVSLGKTENSEIRLQSLVDSTNGFDIAKADLAVRGEGTMFDISQSGRSDLIFASLSRHMKKIPEAREAAERILKSPFREMAIKDAHDKFDSDERLF